MQSPRGVGVFGVFDGHGGPSAAQICQDELCAQLATAGPSATDAALADAFWSVDARIGAAGDMSGTTAAVLLVDGWNMPGVVNLRCVLANVGDSRGLRVDMRSPVAAALPFATRKHTPADADEVNRLKLTVRVRDQLSRMRAGAADSSTIRSDASSVRSTYSAYATSRHGSSRARRPSSERSAAGSERSAASSADDTPATLDEKARARAFTRAELDAALASLGLTLDGGSDASDASLLLRGLQREARMELSERRLHPTLRRENSGLGKRFDTWGPVVLKSARFRVAVQAVRGSFRRGTRVRAEPEEQPRTVPVSTAVTRSVGDWDAARTLIPHPDLYRFDVGSSQHERVVLASDGVWDFVTPVQAAKITRNTPGAREASAALLRLATDRSHAKFGALKDDVSVVVVDLNPGALDVEKPLSSPGTPGALLRRLSSASRRCRGRRRAPD